MEAYFPITDSIQGVQTITFTALDTSIGVINIEWWQLAPPHEFPSRLPLLCKEGGDFSSSSGNLVIYAAAGNTVGNIDNNEWMTYSNIDFGDSPQYSQIMIRYSKDGGTPSGKLEVKLGNGTVIGNFVNPSITGSWDTYVEAYISITDSIQGIHDVTFTALDTVQGFMNIDSWALVK